MVMGPIFGLPIRAYLCLYGSEVMDYYSGVVRTEVVYMFIALLPIKENGVSYLATFCTHRGVEYKAIGPRVTYAV